MSPRVVARTRLDTTAQPLASAAGRHVVTRQGSHDPLDVEVLHGQAEMIDMGSRGPGLGERQEVRSVTDAEKDLPLPAGLHGHAEEPLVEIQRAFQIRDGERHLV